MGYKKVGLSLGAGFVYKRLIGRKLLFLSLSLFKGAGGLTGIIFPIFFPSSICL